MTKVIEGFLRAHLKTVEASHQYVGALQVADNGEGVRLRAAKMVAKKDSLELLLFVLRIAE